MQCSHNESSLKQDPYLLSICGFPYLVIIVFISTNTQSNILSNRYVIKKTTIIQNRIQSEFWHGTINLKIKSTHKRKIYMNIKIMFLYALLYVFSKKNEAIQSYMRIINIFHSKRSRIIHLTQPLLNFNT